VRPAVPLGPSLSFTKMWLAGRRANEKAMLRHPHVQGVILVTALIVIALSAVPLAWHSVTTFGDPPASLRAEATGSG
jgi:hypothetical protein